MGIKRSKMIGKMVWLIGSMILSLAACANVSGADKKSGNFMTEREQAAAEEERTREEEERAAKEEYVAGHKIELQGDTPLDMFLVDVDRYDVMAQLGSADSMRNIPIGVIETYEQASYGEFQGSLMVTYYEFDGALSPRHERLYEAEWSCDTVDDSSWVLAEELIYFFEDQYGEYDREELGSDMTMYSWNLENGFDLDVVVGVSDSYSLKVRCYFTDQYYTIEYINAYLADYEKVFTYEAPELSQWPQDYWHEWSEEKIAEMTEEELGTWEGRYLGNNGLIMEIVPLTGKLNADGNYDLEVSIYDADKVELFCQNVWAWTCNGEYSESIEDIQGNWCTTSLWLERADYGHQIVVTQELGVSATNLTGIYTREGMDPTTVWRSSADATIDPMDENVYSENNTIEYSEGVYDEFYNNYRDIVSETYLTWGEYATYSIYDIDKDGVEELLVSYGESDADWHNEVWSKDENGIIYFGFFYDPVVLYEAGDGNGIYAVSGHQGVQKIDQITKVGNVLYIENIMLGELAPEEEYYSNDNPIEEYSVSDMSILD